MGEITLQMRFYIPHLVRKRPAFTAAPTTAKKIAQDILFFLLSIELTPTCVLTPTVGRHCGKHGGSLQAAASRLQGQRPRHGPQHSAATAQCALWPGTPRGVTMSSHSPPSSGGDTLCLERPPTHLSFRDSLSLAFTISASAFPRSSPQLHPPSTQEPLLSACRGPQVGAWGQVPLPLCLP